MASWLADIEYLARSEHRVGVWAPFTLSATFEQPLLPFGETVTIPPETEAK